MQEHYMTFTSIYTIITTFWCLLAACCRHAVPSETQPTRRMRLPPPTSVTTQPPLMVLISYSKVQ